MRRRFFNFGEPEPEVDPDDPGRVAMCGEYQNNMGPIVYAKEGPFGWATVAQHSASEQDGFWPGGTPPGEVTQEWRELRLAGKPGSPQPGAGEGTGQSVVKVSLCDGQTPAMVPYCMCLAYTKSMCALAMTGAHLQGALPLDDVPAQRALVVGLGAGSMPVWLNHTFPDGKMVVDAVEIDPAVIATAKEAMGFPGQAMRPTPEGDAAAAAEDAVSGAGGEPVRVYAVGGEAFVEALAGKSPDGYVYDMVFIDAFDKAGAVPPVLVDPEGPFLKGLSGLLAPRATIVLNLLVGMTGSGSSGGPKEIESMTNAIYSTLCDQDKAEAFMVRTPINESSGNVEYAFLRQGRPDGREKPLKDALAASAEAVNEGFPPDSLGKKIRFEFKRRVNFAYSDWSPGGGQGEAQKQGGGGGGLFGF